MRPSLHPVFDKVPAAAAGAVSLAANAGAVVGAGLVLLATIYGDWVPAAWAAGVFALSGLLWHAADRSANR